jgi:hypothetical protein
VVLRVRRKQRQASKLLTLGIYDLEVDVPCEARPTAFPGFEQHFLNPLIPWRGVLASAVLQAGCIALVPLISFPGLYREQDEPKITLRSVEPLRIRLPDELFVAAPKAAQSAKLEPPRPEASGQIKEPAGSDDPGSGAKVRAYRSFELPKLPPRAASEQTVLQLQFPPDMPLARQATLPQVMFWAPQMSKLRPPEPKKFVMPGREMPKPEMPQLSEPPKLEPPNPDAVITGMRIRGPLLAQDNVKLPVPPGTSVPVRTFVPPEPNPIQRPSLDLLPGDATNLLAFHPAAPPLTPELVVPPGNQLGRLPPPDETGTAGLGQRSEGIAKTEGTSSVAGEASASRGSGDGPTTARGLGSAGAAAKGGSGGAGTAAGGSGGAGTAAGGSGGGGTVAAGSNPGGRGTGVARTGGAGNPSLAGSIPIRILHPENGVFDIVVERAAPLEDIPEGNGLLKGRPVYTVYLKLGTPKEWILQYCVPKMSDGIVQRSASVIQLGNPAPVKAPYPRITLMPPLAMVARSRRTVLHGFIDSRGQFRGLQVVREEDQEYLSRIAPFLQYWEFRPATRDGQPVEVEMLLVIPPLEI